MTEAGCAELFLTHLADTFERASTKYRQSLDVLLGERRVRLHFASKALAELLVPALRCVELTPSGEPALTLYAWDGFQPDGAPNAPWPPAAVGRRGEVEGFNTERFCVVFNVDAMALSAADLAFGRAYFWTPALSSLAAYEKAAPFRAIFSWFAQTWGGQLVHAGAVVANSSGALLVGPSGSGKSTTALACWRAGLGYLSDDYCALLPSSAGYIMASIYTTAKLEARHLAQMFPELADRKQPAWAQDHAKSILCLRDELRLGPTSARLTAIIAPTIAPQATSELSPCGAADALSALAPSSIFQTPRIGEAAFAFYAQVVAEVRCYRLRLGHDLDHVSETLGQLVRLGVGPSEG